MAIKNLLDDFQNAVLIAQAGIKATVKSMKNAQSKAKKLTARNRTNKPTGKPKKRLSAKNPADPKHLVRSVVKAASGEPLTPKKRRKKKPASKPSKK